MPRSLWSGSLSFGLVNVPVRLLSAARDLDLHFRQLHEEDGTPIDTRRFCKAEGVEVPYEALARSYEFDDGTEVVVADEELEAVAPRATKTIDIERFVDLADVDPVFFDHPYLLAPAEENEGALRAYRLLVEVMGRTDRAALGRVVIRTKEYLALVRVRDGVLTLTTMRFADEVRPVSGVDAGKGATKPAKKALDAAVELLDAMTVEWDPARYEDRYRARLRALVEQKQAGETIKAPEQADEPGPAPDLMAALEASLRAVREGDAAAASSAGDGDAGGDGARGGGDDAGALRRLKKDELLERAKAADIEGRSSMTKDELVEALAGA